MTTREEFDQLDRELLDRWRSFVGHIEDMGAEEKAFMLGALAGSLDRRLRDGGTAYGESGAEFRLWLAVEPKDECYCSQRRPAMHPGHLPTRNQIGAYVSDRLGDETKRNEQLGWRVTRVSQR